jgi:quinol monooxygenase YgiN
MIHTRYALVLLFSLGACGTSATPAAMPDAGSSDVSEDPMCTRAALEPDFRGSPLAGPGVDAAGRLAPGRYVLSTTQIRLRPTAAAGQRFGALMEVLTPALAAQAGLVAYSLGTSTRCNTGRTLSVWRDEAAMFAFVAGAPHQAAVNAVTEVSRGGSTVTHWNDDASGATWTTAARTLAESNGPEY